MHLFGANRACKLRDCFEQWERAVHTPELKVTLCSSSSTLLPIERIYRHKVKVGVPLLYRYGIVDYQARWLLSACASPPAALSRMLERFCV